MVARSGAVNRQQRELPVARRHHGAAAALVRLGLAAAVLSGAGALAQSGTAAAPAAATNPPAASAHSKAVRAPARSAGPAWSELSAAQHEALAPLANHWNPLSEAQKRKWLLVSKNYRRMPPADQARLHGRMNDWAALSPQQRQTARFNFAETKRLSSDEKQKKWQAYQELSPEDRRRFTEGAQPVAPGAAAALGPQPRPGAASAGGRTTSLPRIVGVRQLDPHTLLPQRGAAPPGTAPRPNGR